MFGRNARKPGDPIRLVYAGRFVEHQKRITNYVKLARLLARAGVPFTLTMIGDGDLFERVRAELRDLVAAGSVKLPGRLPPEAVTGAFGEADVFLLLSDFEGLPLSLLEAMSLGCVPVTWNLDSGVPEIIADSKNGFVLPIGDLDGVVSRISMLQNERDLLKEVSRASLESFKMHKLDETTMADAYATLFEATLHETRNRTRPRHPSLSLYEGGVLPPTWLAGVRRQ
jgi:glycosyltransferase involved in cell wall biosynthesis